MKKVITIIQHLLVKVTGTNSKARHFLKGVFMYFPRKYRESYLLDKTIKSLAKREDINFIQIGANDGIHCDPLFHYVKKKCWNGLLVEPNPHVFQQLIKNHKKSKSNLTFSKYAIGDSGIFKLFWYKEDSAMASFNKKHIQKQLKGRNYKILEENVKVVPFTQLIRENQDFSKVNILLIDTESWDSKIVQSIDFKNFYSDIIIFEAAHIENNEFKKTIKYLENNGYKCFTSRIDTTAIHIKTKLKELHYILEHSDKL